MIRADPAWARLAASSSTVVACNMDENWLDGLLFWVVVVFVVNVLVLVLVLVVLVLLVLLARACLGVAGVEMPRSAAAVVSFVVRVVVVRSVLVLVLVLVLARII